MGTEYADAEEAIDSYTYLHEIQGGFEKDTFQDEPYLIPYVVEGIAKRWPFAGTTEKIDGGMSFSRSA